MHVVETLFEDLGDTSLYAYLQLPHDARSIEDAYRDVLKSLVAIHAMATEHVDECPLLQARIFDYNYLRWETTYFLDRFVVGLRKRQVENRSAVDAELHRLAQRVDGYARGIIHRDFQCQNIMIHGGVPRIIDYQGARMAPPAYDVASILWDPYHHLDDAVRERLLGYYVGELGEVDAEQLRIAIEEFQCDQELTVNGEADQPTRDRLLELHGC